MAKKLYVGNLSYEVTENELTSLFNQCGQVTGAKVIIDKISNRSKGFGFVDMPNDEEARHAIQRMHGFELKGRSLKVNEAKEFVPGSSRNTQSYNSAPSHREGSRSFPFKNQSSHEGPNRFNNRNSSTGNHPPAYPNRSDNFPSNNNRGRDYSSRDSSPNLRSSYSHNDDYGNLKSNDYVTRENKPGRSRADRHKNHEKDKRRYDDDSGSDFE